MDELSQICEGQHQWKGRLWYCDCFPDQSATLAVFPILEGAQGCRLAAPHPPFPSFLAQGVLEMSLLGFRVWGTGREGKPHFPKAVVTRPHSHKAKQKEQ